MAIFTPVLPTPTAEQLVVDQLLASGDALFAQMLETYTTNYDAVWLNPHPDRVVAAMGTNAAKVFRLSAALGAYLTAAGATVIPLTMPPGWNYQENADGSVALQPVTKVKK